MVYNYNAVYAIIIFYVSLEEINGLQNERMAQLNACNS